MGIKWTELNNKLLFIETPLKNDQTNYIGVITEKTHKKTIKIILFL